ERHAGPRRYIMAPRILIAGIGNIFLGDDAFGVEVAQRLAQRSLPDGVRVVDYGIRGFDLAYAMMDEPEVTILVDAAPRGEQPGTLYLIEPDLAEIAQAGASIETHSMNPVRVLQLVQTLGGQPGRVLVLGCEPQSFDSDDGHIGLTPPVAAAADEAVHMLEELIASLLAELSLNTH
ncbi:MAG TPA: hydrogenase maturation protease, partial [Roseiflexaceae bacterium]|nr:hydrogenase maturation protease [Roseiflexaceae bacterium]